MPEPIFETVFQAPLHCESCVNDVRNSLSGLSGLQSLDVDLGAQLVTVKGCVPPSLVVKRLQEIGKDAIIRGSGKPDSAAVCILESFNTESSDRSVKGLARLVEVAPNEVVVDLTISNLAQGLYYPSIRASGDLSRGPLSTGAVYHAFPSLKIGGKTNSVDKRGSPDTFEARSGLGSGQSFMFAHLGIKDLIGRSIVISTSKSEVGASDLCGVIARSAGAWENDKYVCSCSGKNLWQERQEALAKGL